MHSCETLPAPPATGPALLQQLGRLVMRARSPSAPPPLQPSTSQQVSAQPRARAEPGAAAEAELGAHVHALWHDQIPLCIEVLLAPDCAECFAKLSRAEGEAFDKSSQWGMLLERWTMSVAMKKNHEQPPVITSQWLLSAVRSQLHFSQLGAWLARLSPKEGRKRAEDPSERRRKLSRESCNIKKLESNRDPSQAEPGNRQLNVLYCIKIPGESYRTTDFTRTPTDHAFPLTDIGNNVHLKVVLESLPRIGDAPAVRCLCSPPKRRASKETPSAAHEELTTRINDLTLGTNEGHRSHFTNDLGAINSNAGCPSGVSRRLSIFSNKDATEYILHKETDDRTDGLLDDRMHTPCSESGKHKCSCDDESDPGKESHNTSKHHQETKKLDERRLKEIAKYKRRMRKESKMRKLRDSTSESTGTSEGDGLNAKSKETHTSIPILQASRFDRFRAIGCYRNQTYLTLPASRIETKSPFLTDIAPPLEFKKTNTIATQTDDVRCDCGGKIFTKCDECKRGMKRSEGVYDLMTLEEASKKLKCDNIVLNNNKPCDISSLSADAVGGVRKSPEDDVNTNIIKRQKLKKFLPAVGRIDKVVYDRSRQGKPNDKDELLLNDDDSVFDRSKQPLNPKLRQTKSFLNEDYILNEKCYYGPYDRCEAGSPVELSNMFVYPDTSKTHPEINKLKATTPANSRILKHPNNNSGAANGFPTPSSTESTVLGTPNHNQNIPDPNETQSPSYDSDVPEPENGFQFPDPQKDSQVPSPTEMDRFRWRFDSAASMVFHTKTGLPLTSSPAPLKRGSNCFDYDDSINGISGIKSALFHPIRPRAECVSPASPRPAPPPPPSARAHRPNVGPSGGLLGSFEESALKGRLEPAATVQGFTAELGASGAFCPPHRRLPVTVFFYAPGGTNAPYMGHINLGEGGYRVARSGTIQVSLFNPHGTLVKMFVVLYSLTAMPPSARTFLRQRTLYLPAGCAEPSRRQAHRYMRYLIHLRFMTSKSGKLYLHTDIRIIVSRKADLDTATAHSAIFKSISANGNPALDAPTNHKADETTDEDEPTNHRAAKATNNGSTNRNPCRVFGGCGDFKDFELGYENQNGVSYELRSFTYGPENPKYSPR